MATAIPENSASFTREQIAAATGGTLVGPAWAEVCGVVTDSRRVTSGSLFVALRGERFDAHDFAASAAQGGATAVVVQRGTALPPEVSAVEVDDTLLALGGIAAAHRTRWGGTLIGVTGSVGKTTTKELLAAALSASGKNVLKTSGNLNNLIGVPLTLFQLDADHDAAVIEMGTSRPGEISRLAGIAKPDAGIVTRAAVAHTEGLGSVGAIADEKMALLHALGADGVAVTYGDDAPLRKRAGVLTTNRRLFYGRAPENDVRVLDWRVDGKRTLASVQVRGGSMEIDLRMLGEGAVLNAAGALAVMFGLGLDIEAAVAGMSEVPPTPGRLVPMLGTQDRFLIDDTYNSNPASVEVALRTARAVAEQRSAPLVVVLGDMKELGTHSEDEHRKVGDLVSDSDAFLFVGCGEEMHLGVDTANARGVDTLWFQNAVDCAEIADRLPLNAVVLVKGSRSMEMERVLSPMRREDAA